MAAGPDSLQHIIPSPGGDPPSVQRVFRRLAMVSGLLAAAMAITGVLTARTGIILVGNADSKTIAMSAALIWIFLGAVLVYHSARPTGRIAGLLVQAVLILIAAFGIVEFLYSIQESHFFLETFLTRAGTAIIGPSSTPISPVATAFAIPAAITLAIDLRCPGPEGSDSPYRDAVSLAGLAISLVSLTFIMSYAYGDPLLYDTRFIPIAFFSASAAFFTGTGLIAAAGPGAFPARYFIGDSTSAGLLRVFVPLVVATLFIENFVILFLASWLNIRNAVMLAATLVVFVFATALGVGRVSGRSGRALEEARRELVRKNDDLHAINEELTATQEELRQNIDELTAAEKALRESEERFRTIAEQTPVQLSIARRSDGGLLYTNPSYDRAFGFAPGELAARGTPELYYDPRDRVTVLGIFQEKGSVEDHELRVRRKDGTPFWVSLSLRPIRFLGLDALLAATFDITRRKRSEEALLEKNTELSALNEELTATQEELRQNLDELANKERELGIRNEDLNATNEELNATQEELQQTISELGRREQDLRKNEDDLKESLEEKEILLSEIHHRVKNNLSAFISLLNLEGSYQDTPEGNSLRLDLQNRARSMALVHETLYRTKKYSQVDMDVYLSTLVNQIAATFPARKPVTTRVSAEGVTIDVARATPCGLIITELMTNALKHAFPESAACGRPGGDPCIFRVEFTMTDDFYTLTVSDNGIGLPASVDTRTARSLGLKLVGFLARHQLQADVETDTSAGTRFTFRFRA